MANAAFYTLGCKVNQTETAALQNLFGEAGYETVPFEETADVYVINTCTVTHLSDRKSRQMIRRARRTNPDAVIVVTGCYAQVSADDIMEIPEVDLVIGTHSRHRLPELVQEAKKGRLNCVAPWEEKQGFEAMPASQSGERTRAFLKVQEGCRQFCSYCIVPYARGPLHSRPPEDAAAEAERLAEQGFSEMVLSGVHLGSYGEDLPGELALSDLIRELVTIEKIRRIRISSIEPTEITPDLIEVLLDYPKVCRHLHIPLQSGDDHVLRRMNRKYDSAEFLQLIRWLRAQIPEIAITTDVMVGFPGETDAQFEHTLEMVRKCGFSRIHVFKYSPRSGTPAAKFDEQISPQVKEERSRRLIELGEELAATFRRRFIGETVEVLFEESTEDGQITGLTEHYVRVTAEAPQAMLGQIAKVDILSDLKEGLLGKVSK
ncbi:tRNA (N(6)-L-threonylcarbamoyladenosine(37)-C(2))-methylthiotransferase MtaB [Dethiobacter alkaliphilus]|uniref:tRNA (N(6)-L-threonylcarbamoyladenosine(37)-C(2))- methylthiotransferase MtaB n=1 Tax=Dethiobacter alkaliphilus TaxID=427926 RepID=UPI0022275A42|nr:tRNA (N(6)-L-threonylcarbamoyladenosine(37)-C(2))-methylthiotransferase MtaB [Dethiobacter alkaliphilus]MCW3489323.1 tRNA (N(6)-L-threonylcarbamoyladenosine(37)-C(2))-methylthiotransferase MtaB [Dethiobacter alkaliphilus]